MASLVFDRVQQSACGVVHRDAVTDSIGDVDEAARLVYGQAKRNKSHSPGEVRVADNSPSSGHLGPMVLSRSLTWLA